MEKISKNIVVIGSSTGGPRILESVLRGLPKLSASVILVQHMPKLINRSFADRLNSYTDMEVDVAEDREFIEVGRIYVAPSEVHLELENNRRIRLVSGEKVNFVMPSVDVVMKSLRKNQGDNIVGVILTGMGKDGAAGIAHIKDIGGTTVVQDEKTCMIYSMPEAAVETGRVDSVLTPERIKQKLIELFYTR